MIEGHATNIIEVPASSVDLRAAVASVLATGGPAVDRLAKAQTTVAFVVTDAPDRSVTVLLDRRPPVVSDDGEPVEVTFELSSEQAERFGRGHLHLPLEVLSGEVRARGPVRKYLPKDPILRALLRGAG